MEVSRKRGLTSSKHAKQNNTECRSSFFTKSSETNSKSIVADFMQAQEYLKNNYEEKFDSQHEV
jgi:hypothetical protein